MKLNTLKSPFFFTPAFILFFILHTGCSSKHSEPTVDEQSDKSGTMVASWYGPKFHGNPTSSGEIYNMYKRTAAHKSLPFGTRLKVTNPDSGKSTNIVINDRGPFIHGRDLDLSFKAAEDIGLIRQGTGKVEIEHLGRDNRYLKRITVNPLEGQPFTIQVASFSEHTNAIRLKKSLELSHKQVYIQEALVKGRSMYRVRLGKFDNKKEALAMARTLSDEGYATLVTTYDQEK